VVLSKYLDEYSETSQIVSEALAQDSCQPVTLLPPYNASSSCTHTVGVGEQYSDIPSALNAIGGNVSGKVVCVKDNKTYGPVAIANKSGTPESPLIIKSHPGNANPPRFADPSTPADTNRYRGVINVANSKGLVLDGLEVSQSPSIGFNVAGSESILLKNIVVHNNYTSPIRVIGTSKIVLDGCRVYDYEEAPNSIGGGPESILSVNSEQILFQNCLLWDNVSQHGGGGVFGILRSSNVTVRNNEVYAPFIGPVLHPDQSKHVLFENNVVAGHCAAPVNGTGFYWFDEPYGGSHNGLPNNSYRRQQGESVAARNNFIIGSSGGLYVGGCQRKQDEGPGGPNWMDGECVARNVIVQNNTVVGVSRNAFLYSHQYDRPPEGLTIKDNVFHANGAITAQQNPVGQHFSGNIWSKPPYGGNTPSQDQVINNLTGVFPSGVNPSACIDQNSFDFNSYRTVNGKGADMDAVGNREGLDYQIWLCPVGALPPLVTGLPPFGEWGGSRTPLSWNYTLQDLVRIFEGESETVTRNWGPSYRTIPVSRQSEPQAVYCGDDGQPSSTPVVDDERIYTAIGCIPISTAKSFILFVLERALGIGGGITFLLIIYAGYKIMTSNADPKKLQAGRDLLTAAISGLIFIIFSVIILRVIASDILRLPGL